MAFSSPISGGQNTSIPGAPRRRPETPVKGLVLFGDQTNTLPQAPGAPKKPNEKNALRQESLTALQSQHACVQYAIETAANHKN